MGIRRRQSLALLGSPTSTSEPGQAAGAEPGDAALQTPPEQGNRGSGGSGGPAGRRRRRRRRRGRTLTYWLGVWKKRQEQRNWQHMGSRW